MSESGSTIDFVSVVRNTHTRVRAWIAGLGFLPHEVDLIAVEVYREFHARLDEAPPDIAPQSWLKELARGACLHHLEESNPPGLAFRIAIFEVLAETQTPLQELAAGGELSARVERCHDELDPETRRLAQWKFQDRLTLAALAEKLGQDSATAAVALKRLRCKLRDCVTRS